VFYRTFWPVPAYPLNLPGCITVGWLVAGFVFALWARRTRPDALAAVLARGDRLAARARAWERRLERLAR